MRKSQLTRQGFMELNLMEATEKEGDPTDLWISLEAVGYNRMLELVHVSTAAFIRSHPRKRRTHPGLLLLFAGFECLTRAPPAGVSVPDRRPL